MSRVLTIASLAAAIGVVAPASADPAPEILSAAASSAAGSGSKIKVFRQKPCGAKEDLFFCGSFGVSGTPLDPKGSVSTPKLKVKAAKG